MAGLCRPGKFQKRYDELQKAQAERLAKRELELENARLLMVQLSFQRISVEQLLQSAEGFIPTSCGW